MLSTLLVSGLCIHSVELCPDSWYFRLLFTSSFFGRHVSAPQIGPFCNQLGLANHIAVPLAVSPSVIHSSNFQHVQ
jgi:hypothetical protein